MPEAHPDDRLPEVSETAVTVSGDLWQLGKHRVLCGNSLSTASYERLMEGAKADLVITDPPYNVVIDGHATGNGSVHHREFAMASGEMSSTEFTEFLRKAMLAARDQSIAGSLAYYFMDWRHMTEILSAGRQVYTELLKPPKATQFQRGVSGNPKGRPKKAMDFDTEILRESEAFITINDNGKRKSISKLQGIVKQLHNKALTGNIPATRIYFNFYQQALERAALSAPPSSVTASVGFHLRRKCAPKMGHPAGEGLRWLRNLPTGIPLGGITDGKRTFFED